MANPRVVVTNDTYTFTPQPHGIFNQIQTDKKVLVVTQSQPVKAGRTKGGK